MSNESEIERPAAPAGCTWVLMPDYAARDLLALHAKWVMGYDDKPTRVDGLSWYWSDTLDEIREMNPPRTEPYCCAQHALCNVDVPGSDGAHARAELARLHVAGVDDYCGRRRGAHGSLIIESERA